MLFYFFSILSKRHFFLVFTFPSLIYLFSLSISSVLFLTVYIYTIIHFNSLLFSTLHSFFQHFAIDNKLCFLPFLICVGYIISITRFFLPLVVLSFSQHLLFSISLSTSHFSICPLSVLPDLFSLH